MTYKAALDDRQVTFIGIDIDISNVSSEILRVVVLNKNVSIEGVLNKYKQAYCKGTLIIFVAFGTSATCKIETIVIISTVPLNRSRRGNQARPIRIAPYCLRSKLSTYPIDSAR